MNNTQIVGLAEIRETVFVMPDKFTIRDVVNKIKTSYPEKEEVDSMLIRAFLDQIGTAGIVEEVRGSSGTYLFDRPVF